MSVYIVWLELEELPGGQQEAISLDLLDLPRTATFSTEEEARRFIAALHQHARNMIESGDWA